MRRRLIAIFLALVTVAGGSLAGPAPAGAVGLSHGCGDRPPGQIACFVTVPQGREVVSIQWFVNGLKYTNSGSTTSMVFPCVPGLFAIFSYELYLSPPPHPNPQLFTGSISHTCPGPRLANIFAGCSSGGSRLRCSVSYDGGTPPVSIRWTINGDLRTFFNDRWYLDLSCRAPSEMHISVTVSDAYGSLTAAGYCFCHSGPID